MSASEMTMPWVPAWVCHAVYAAEVTWARVFQVAYAVTAAAAKVRQAMGGPGAVKGGGRRLGAGGGGRPRRRRPGWLAGRRRAAVQVTAGAGWAVRAARVFQETWRWLVTW